MTYNVTELTQGTNIMEWMIIMNSWANGHPLGVFIVIVSLIVLGVMTGAGVRFINALIATSFISFLITLLMWAARFAGDALVPTFYPFVFGGFLGFAAFAKIMDKILNE
jgi:hypothetical protein